MGVSRGAKGRCGMGGGGFWGVVRRGGLVGWVRGGVAA